MNNELFNKRCNSIYNDILCFISMHWISCSYFGNCSLNLSESLSVDWKDWSLSNTCNAWIISALTINWCKFIWSCRSNLEIVMLPVWLTPSAAWLFDFSRLSDVWLNFHVAWLFLYRFVLLKTPADILYKMLYNSRCWPGQPIFHTLPGHLIFCCHLNISHT